MKLAALAVSPSKPFIQWPPPHRNVAFGLVPLKSSRISHRTASAVASLRVSAIPARDRGIDFGKFKGRILGSLPSAYLKWVSKNLRAGDTEEWTKLADRVLDDRLEWEAVEKIFSGNAASSCSGGNGGSAVAELLEISERFGWDNEDKSGWSKIDIIMLHKGKIVPKHYI